MVISRQKTIWVLTAWFAAVVGVGEGWHLFPGNGHLVEYPGGYSIYLGSGDLETQPLTDPTELALRSALPAVRGADGCPICLVSAQARVGAQGAALTLSSVTAQLPAATEAKPYVSMLRMAYARAPPRS